MPDSPQRRPGAAPSVDLGALRSGAVTAAVPCVLVFHLLQRHDVRGFTSGALKG